MLLFFTKPIGESGNMLKARLTSEDVTDFGFSHISDTSKVRFHADLGGIYLDSNGKQSRKMSWQELAELLRGEQRQPCRYGVVIDGKLAEVKISESEAWDRVAEHRGHGCEVQVIRMSADPV
jgi:hypothetical protein